MMPAAFFITSWIIYACNSLSMAHYDSSITHTLLMGGRAALIDWVGVGVLDAGLI